MEYKFNKELYSKPSLFKTCYKYLDDFYIHLDQDDTYYYVSQIVDKSLYLFVRT